MRPGTVCTCRCLQAEEQQRQWSVRFPLRGRIPAAANLPSAEGVQHSVHGGDWCHREIGKAGMRAAPWWRRQPAPPQPATAPLTALKHMLSAAVLRLRCGVVGGGHMVRSGPPAGQRSNPAADTSKRQQKATKGNESTPTRIVVLFDVLAGALQRVGARRVRRRQQAVAQPVEGAHHAAVGLRLMRMGGAVGRSGSWVWWQVGEVTLAGTLARSGWQAPPRLA